MRRAMPAHDGATLVEVLVAVSVLGALAAIGIPQYASYTERGREAQCVANRHNMEEAARACAAEKGKPCLTTQELVDSGYLDGMPKCPSGGTYVWLKDDPSDPEAPKMGCSKHYWDPGEERHAEGGEPRRNLFASVRRHPICNGVDDPYGFVRRERSSALAGSSKRRGARHVGCFALA